MNKYEITERGKILFAVVIIGILILFSTSVVLLGYFSAAPPDGPPLINGSTPGEDDPTLSNTPLPTPGSGFDPITPSPDPTPTPTPTPTPDETLPPGGDGDGNGHGGDYPEFGPVGLNLAEGTMLFIFAPSVQETLDDDTVSMLSEFLTSPKNTPEAKVQVEMPNLTEDDTEHLLVAVSNAFSGYGVKVNEIVYVKNNTEVDGSSFEVSLSFYVATAGK